MEHKQVKNILFSLLTLIFPISLFAEDLFFISDITQDESKIIVTFSIYDSYQPFVFDCYAEYVWDFGDGNTEGITKYPSNSYTETTHKYDITSNLIVDRDFETFVTLTIRDYSSEFTLGNCGITNIYTEQETVSYTLESSDGGATNLIVDFYTKPEVNNYGNYDEKSILSFFCKIVPITSQNLDNLSYNLDLSWLSDNNDVQGIITYEDLYTEKDLQYTSLPLNIGSYSATLEILRYNTIIYSKEIPITVTLQGTDGTDPEGCSRGFRVNTAVRYLGPLCEGCSVGEYEVKIQIERVPTDEVTAQNNSLVSANVDGSYIFGGPHYYVRYGDLADWQKEYIYNPHMGVNSETRYDIFRFIAYTPSGETVCQNIYKKITIPAQPFLVSEQNIYNIDSRGGGVTIPTYIEDCIGVSATDVNHPENPIYWAEVELDIPYDAEENGHEFINVDAEINLEEERELELRVFAKESSIENYFIDESENQNNYRKIRVIQPSIFNPVDPDSPGSTGMPFSNNTVLDETAYIELNLLDENGYPICISNLYDIPIEWLIQAANENDGIVTLYFYDENGNEIYSESYSFRNGICNFPYYIGVMFQYDIYIVNRDEEVSWGSEYSIPSDHSIMLNARDKITLVPGFNANKGCYFKTQLNGCLEVPESSNSQADIDIEFKSSPLSLQKSIEREIIIYPNPTKGTFIVEFPEGSENIITIDIYTVTGQRIESKTSGFEQKNEFNANNWLYGVYLVRITTNDGYIVKRLLKK